MAIQIMSKTIITADDIEDLRLSTEDAMLCEEIFYKDELINDENN